MNTSTDIYVCVNAACEVKEWILVKFSGCERLGVLRRNDYVSFPSLLFLYFFFFFFYFHIVELTVNSYPLNEAGFVTRSCTPRDTWDS